MQGLIVSKHEIYFDVISLQLNFKKMFQKHGTWSVSVIRNKEKKPKIPF